MKKQKIDLISKKAEDEVEYLLFLERHSDCHNLFKINGLFGTPLRMIQVLHQTKDQNMVN